MAVGIYVSRLWQALPLLEYPVVEGSAFVYDSERLSSAPEKSISSQPYIHSIDTYPKLPVWIAPAESPCIRLIVEVEESFLAFFLNRKGYIEGVSVYIAWFLSRE
jgi:hypothetical protein